MLSPNSYGLLHIVHGYCVLSVETPVTYEPVKLSEAPNANICFHTAHETTSSCSSSRVFMLFICFTASRSFFFYILEMTLGEGGKTASVFFKLLKIVHIYRQNRCFL